MRHEENSERELPEGIAIGPWIRMKQAALTSTENMIVDWCMVAGNLTPGMSIKEIARTLNVSEAMIVKVAKSLGLNGFRQLRGIIEEYFLTGSDKLSSELSVDDSLDDTINKIFNITSQTISEGLEIIEQDEFLEAAKCFSLAEQREIYGVGGSNSVCADFQHKLLRIGVRANCYQDAHIMMMSACQLSEKDVVLVISHSGRTNDLNEVVMHAKESGAKVICITHSDNSPLAKISDYRIHSPAPDSPLLGRNASARILQLTLLDVLFALIAKQDIKKTMESLEKMKKVENFYTKNFSIL